MKPDDDFQLMDALHAWTFNDRKYKLKPVSRRGKGPVPPDMKGQVIPLNDEGRTVQRFLRGKLREAQRFVLDDDAVRLVCNLSLEVDRLPGWSILANLPYDTVWFEYDVHVKLRELERLDRLNGTFNGLDPMIPKRTGYLLYREQPEGECQRWVAHFYAMHSPDEGEKALEVVPGMVSFVFDPQGDPLFPLMGSSVWKTATLSARKDLDGNFHMPLGRARENGLEMVKADPEVVLTGLPVDGNVGSQLKGDRMENPEWLAGRMAAIIDPWWDASFTTMKLTPEWRGKLLSDEVVENAGHFRWILTMLAAIGGLPRNVREMRPRPGKHTVGMNQLPYFSCSGLTINLPVGDRILRAKRELDKHAKNSLRAWHMVRGHWRVIERGKRSYMCRHSPVLQEHDLALCERCGLLVRRIKAYPRGDPNIGIRDHKYTVTA